MIFGRRTGVPAGADSWIAPDLQLWARPSAPPFVADKMPGGLIPAALAQPAAPAPTHRAARNASPSRARATSSSCSATVPLVAGDARHLLDDDTTPTDKFFIHNNAGIPDEAKGPKWKLVIDGE